MRSITLDQVAHVSQLSRQRFVIFHTDVAVVTILIERKHTEPVHEVQTGGSRRVVRLQKPTQVVRIRALLKSLINHGQTVFSILALKNDDNSSDVLRTIRHALPPTERSICTR